MFVNICTNIIIVQLAATLKLYIYGNETGFSIFPSPCSTRLFLFIIKKRIKTIDGKQFGYQFY